jgi:L-amino acid N-acyltransferase YncA
MIRPASDGDAPSIAAIYNPYIAETSISFEEQPVSPHEMLQRMQEVRSASLPYLVLEDSQSAVIGYAYASKWKGRCAYRFSVETSIYLAESAVGQGFGAQLYRALLDQLRATQVHLAIAGIALPNDASIALHEKLGFEKSAHFKEIGFKFEKWVDVGYWQLAL